MVSGGQWWSVVIIIIVQYRRGSCHPTNNQWGGIKCMILLYGYMPGVVISTQ